MFKYIVVLWVAIAVSFHPSCGVSLRGSGQRLQQRLSIISELDSKKSIRQINNSEKSLLQLNEKDKKLFPQLSDEQEESYLQAPDKHIQNGLTELKVVTPDEAASATTYLTNLHTQRGDKLGTAKKRDPTLTEYYPMLDKVKKIGQGKTGLINDKLVGQVNAALEEWRMREFRNRPPSPGLSEAELRNRQKLLSGQKLIPLEEREPLNVWSREREEDEYD